MNNPNPLVPQGSLLEEKARSKTSLPVAFFIFLVLHVLVLGGFLMVGCGKTEDPSKARSTLPPLTNDLPPLDTNVVYTPPPPASNAAVASLTSSLPSTTAGGASLAGGGSGNLGSGSNAAALPLQNEMPLHSQTDAGVTATSAEGLIEYKVAKNDNFALIAKKHHTTIKAIEQANPGVKSNKLKVGQKLNVPAGTAAAPSTKTGTGSGPEDGAAVAPSSTQAYVVKPGDNLTKIAKAHGTTLKAIRAANGMKTDRINEGQKLKIPAASGSSAAATETSATVPSPPFQGGGSAPSGNPTASPRP